MLNNLGSVASILGLGVSLYVLIRELRIEKNVQDLKIEEEAWHKENHDPRLS